MGVIKDLTGQKFGRLTVVKQNGHKGKKVAWLCRCDCGNYTTVTGSELKTGGTKSCGCINKERMKGNKIRLTHGGTKTRLYGIWRSMKQRTENPKTINYELYGGRGITVCDEWRDSFEAFRDWAQESGYKDDLTIDRIDHDGPYSPENCRWVDWETQENNRCNNRLITYNGKTQSVSQWAREIGMKPKTLHRRINDKGWSVEKALTTPLMRNYNK